MADHPRAFRNNALAEPDRMIAVTGVTQAAGTVEQDRDILVSEERRLLQLAPPEGFTGASPSSKRAAGWGK
ncbi:hypothetical protein J8J14_21450 [Roseomonas sp. SSH11]|uniref:Uncharacterized protein n=1 Tax=Pararoseomonas baculiformis TaxID=2820812 RepID=A0ABS4ALF6_9PROT|nr:hypothetical protein [Pararoseomonas baculiformis]MBP0447338.1 hypothetical protein [Pararoseomonas baculiformis]